VRVRIHTHGLLSAALLTLGGVLAVCLPVHLARTQYRVRQQAIEALVGDAQGRAAMVGMFLNSRRGEVRDLTDSGVLQRQAGKPGGTGASLDAIALALRSFGQRYQFGGEPCYSSVAYVSRGGDVRSEAVPDAPPVNLTFESLGSLVQQLYLRPAYLPLSLADGTQVMVLSVAVVANGSVHGQILAVLNPHLLDSRLQGVPAYVRRAVYLVSPQGDSYVPGSSPREWQQALREFRTGDTDVATPLPAPAGARDLEPWDEGALAVRTLVPACEFSLVCLEPSVQLPGLTGIVLSLLCYLAIGLGLLALACRAVVGGPARTSPAAEAVLDEEARCFATLFDQLPEGVLVAGLEGDLRRANRAVLERTGLAADALAGTAVHPLLGEVQDEADRGVLNRALQGRQPWFGRMRVARHGGSTETAETAVLPVAASDGQPVGIIVVQRDVTAEVQVADRLRQAQKMEAIGVLADGIAHDFNNLLTVIQGNCALLLGGPESLDAAARDNIDEILRACDRAATMTRRLLAFSRHKGIQLETLDLCEVVRSTEKMLSRLIRENIGMSMVLAETPVMVKADIVQIEQVIINLTVNARDAMPRGGRLTVTVGSRAITARAAGSALEEGDYAVLSVEDTGHGMDEATRRRVFEPFFTTKTEHEGTGLGLTTVQSIVREHGGDVTVHSEVGLGTTFIVWLPLLPQRAAVALPGIEETAVVFGAEPGPGLGVGPAGEPGVSRVAAAPGAGTGIGILVLDDEESVLRMIERGLKAHGYTVFAARTDVELLVQWEEHRNDVALLVTDIVMPGMSGVEVAERLRQDCPDLKVLSISAYTDTVIMKLGAGSRNDAPFLQKPFTCDALVVKVKQLLAEP